MARPAQPPPEPAPARADAQSISPRTPSASDLQGNPVVLFKSGISGVNRGVVLIFVSNDCPICNRYAPVIRRLKENYAKRGIQFWLVHPDPDESVQDIVAHAKEYRFDCSELRDPQHVLVRLAKARITPEAAVFTTDGKLVYHGRIDNRTAAFGVDRPEATRHDLEDVLSALLEGKPVQPAYAPPVGCYISASQ